MKVVKVSDDTYKILEALAKETECSIAKVASKKLIINKDHQLRMGSRNVKNIDVVE